MFVCLSAGRTSRNVRRIFVKVLEQVSLGIRYSWLNVGGDPEAAVSELVHIIRSVLGCASSHQQQTNQHWDTCSLTSSGLVQSAKVKLPKYTKLKMLYCNFISIKADNGSRVIFRVFCHY